MRKLAILTVLAVPVSALGAHAFAANDDAVAPDSPMTVNETEKCDLGTANQSLQLFAMEESDEHGSEAGPILSKGLDFDEDEGDDHDNDD